MGKEDCRIYPEYSGEYLACEIRNERLEASWQQGFAFGGLLFFIIGLALMWVICYAEKKERERKETGRQWDEAHKKHLAELDRLIAEGFKAEEGERKKKRGKK